MCGSDPWNPHCARLLQAVETGFMECQGGVTSVALRSLPLPRGLFCSEHGRQPALFKTTTFHKCQRRPPAHRGLKTPRTPRRSMMSLVARCEVCGSDPGTRTSQDCCKVSRGKASIAGTALRCVPPASRSPACASLTSVWWRLHAL